VTPTGTLKVPLAVNVCERTRGAFPTSTSHPPFQMRVTLWPSAVPLFPSTQTLPLTGSLSVTENEDSAPPSSM